MTMINVTIKTLDSQNHLHSVPDDITVKQFKEKIAGSVNVPADKQRLIYCGRVLQDDKKLSEYNVHEKVVHLVMRAPPQSSGRSGGQGGASTSGGQASHHHHPIHMHHHHHHRRGNNGDGGQVLFGSFMHPEDAEPLTQGPSSSGVRLNQARSMLGRAAAVLDQLDNSSSTTTASAAASSSGTAMQSQPATSAAGQAIRVESSMETESNSGNTTTTSHSSVGDTAGVSPTQDIDAFFSEMDALNSMDPSLIGETPRGPPPMPPPNMMGAFGGSLAGGLAQAASAAVASALSSMTRMPMPPPTSTMPSQGTVRRHAVRITSRSGSPSIRIQSTSSAGNSINPPSTTPSAASNQTTSTSTSEATSRPGLTSTRLSSSSTRPGSTSSSQSSAGTQDTTQPEQGADNDGETGPSLRLEHPRCSVMVEVLDLYRTVQQRLQPHLQRYYTLMSTDPSFESSESEMRNEQWMLSRVAEVLHFISHAVHAISDIMVDLRRAPPRQLRAGPIIIQQPALVQAQINVTTGTDPLQSVNLRNSAQTPSSATTAPTSTANPPTPAPSSAVPTATSTSTSTSTSSSSNMFSSTVSSASPVTVTPTASSSSSPTSTGPTAPTSTASRSGMPGPGMWNIGGGSGFPMDSDGVVFMHVGPNGITIDSVTTDENNQGGGQDPTPELIENLVSSIASQLEVRLGSMNPSYSTPSSVPSSEESTTTTSATSITSSSTSTAPNQSQGAQNRSHNSQAAGNSGTNTTNATHTRVSHRPHVHVTPLNVPGMGMNQFDPFLPCQSHHIRPHARRRHHAHDQTQNSASQAARRRHQAATQVRAKRR